MLWVLHGASRVLGRQSKERRSMKAVILAAGSGNRLGSQLPKCLVPLPNGKTIIGNQIEILRAKNIREIVVVVGFKKELIMEGNPDIAYVYNPNYHLTNTSKSLMVALDCMDQTDVIWLNGDVFLQSEVVERVLGEAGNAIAVNNKKCAEEEVKYQTDESGNIVKISKEISVFEGEAVGINKIVKKDFPILLESLRECDGHDYFEKAIELCIAKGTEFHAVDISDCNCIEVDFKKDLEKIRRFL